MNMTREYDPRLRWTLLALLIALFVWAICSSVRAEEESDRLIRYLRMAKYGRISGELQRQIVADIEFKLEKSKSKGMFTIGKNGKITANKQIFTGKNRIQAKGELIGDEAEEANHPEDLTSYGMVR